MSQLELSRPLWVFAQRKPVQGFCVQPSFHSDLFVGSEFEIGFVINSNCTNGDFANICRYFSVEPYRSSQI